MVIRRWTPGTEAALEQFAKNLQADGLLVRSDREEESPPYPRGGYLVAIDQLADETRRLLAAGRTPYWLEPASPFDDLYSLNVALWETGDGPLTIEIVGPGFMASNLKRGDTTPHESYEVLTETSELHVISHSHVDADRYRRTVGERYSQIAVDLNLDSAENARRYLSDTGLTLLNEHSQAYPPIPRHLLVDAVGWIQALKGGLLGLDLPGPPFVLSASFIGHAARPVIWDIVWPALKYRSPAGPGAPRTE